MKLQMQPGSLRLRLTEADLQRLLEGETLQLDLAHAGAPVFALDVCLRPTPHSGVDAGFELAFDSGASRWRLALPVTVVLDYAGTLPRRDGLSLQADSRNGGSDPPLVVLFEVDVRDSVKVRSPATVVASGRPPSRKPTA